MLLVQFTVITILLLVVWSAAMTLFLASYLLSHRFLLLPWPIILAHYILAAFTMYFFESERRKHRLVELVSRPFVIKPSRAFVCQNFNDSTTLERMYSMQKCDCKLDVSVCSCAYENVPQV